MFCAILSFIVSFFVIIQYSILFYCVLSLFCAIWYFLLFYNLFIVFNSVFLCVNIFV